MRFNDQEYQELIAAAEARRDAVSESKVKGHLTAAIRKLKASAERKRENNTAARRGAIRTGATQ
jgi:hypothetical protein